MADLIDRLSIRDKLYDADAITMRGVSMLNQEQTVDAVPVVHARWISVAESEISGFNTKFAGRDPIGGYVCSNCNEEATLDCNDEFVLSNFCPNCGAMMNGKEQ